MIKEEHLDMNMIKSEPLDGEFSTRDIVSELLGSSVPSSSTNQEPEPMDQDAPVVNTSQLVVPATTTNAAAQWTSSSTIPTFDVVAPNVSTGTVTIPHVNTATGAVKTVQLQTINNQINKPISINQTTGNKQIYLATSNSPTKLITIQTNKPQSLSQSIRPTNLSTQLQFVASGLKVGGSTTLRPIAPRFPASTATVARTPGAQIQIITPGPRGDATQVASNANQGTTRFLIQAVPTGTGATQLRTIAPNMGSLPAGIQLPAIFKDGVVYVPQPVQQNTSNSTGVQLSTVQIAPGATPSLTNQQPVNGVQESISPTRVRKPCNCTKSQCLKLYCDCFANGEFCSNCNCNNCFNNIDHEKERSKAIKSCLERNQYAFHPKIGKGKGETDRRHNKGCHCKRSGCLKNYCECYEAKILCTKLCKCTGCKNFEESPERKTLMHLADAAEVRVQQQNAAKTKLESQMEDLPSRAPILTEAGGKLPFSFVTRDVVEATCRCLLLQAVEAENSNKSKAETQKLILEEFGSCLLKIIHTANKRTAR